MANRCSLRASVPAALALMVIVATAGDAQTVGYTASVNGARWTAPTARVTSVYLFNALDVTGGRLRASVTVPFVRTSVAPAAGATLDTGFVGSSGFADPLARVDVRIVGQPASGFQLAMAGAVKLPLVDASTGRGTGVADYALGANAFTTVRRTSLMGDLLYWRYGEPEGIDYADTWSYNAGIAQVVGRGRHSALISIGGFSSGVGGEPPPVSLTVGLLTLVGRGQSLVVTASTGLTETATDFFVSTSWRISR